MDRNRDDVKMPRMNGCCRMNKKLSLSTNRDFIFGYPGAVDGQDKDNVHNE